jgi:mRNA interferase MazF
MPAMTRYNPGAVVLVHFPFTQLQAAKKRPAVVISPVEYAQRYGDLAVIGLTSRAQLEPFLSLKHWQAAGLVGPSWIKPSVFTLAESIIDRQIGRLSAEDASRIPEALSLLVAGQYRP